MDKETELKPEVLTEEKFDEGTKDSFPRGRAVGA
jgi:hypothetical protein